MENQSAFCCVCECWAVGLHGSVRLCNSKEKSQNATQEYTFSTGKNKLFTGNGAGKTHKKQSGTILVKRRTKQFWNQNSRQRSGLTSCNSLVTTTRLNEKGLLHDATRNPTQEFQNVAKEDTPTRNPKQEFRNVA